MKGIFLNQKNTFSMAVPVLVFLGLMAQFTGRAMAQAYRIDFSKIVRARAARRADSAASFYRACTKTPPHAAL